MNTKLMIANSLRTLYLCVLCSLVFACLGQPSKESLESIEFLGTTFHLQWQVDPAPDYVKYEYLPEGEEPQTYQQMILLEYLINGLSVETIVNTQVETLERLASENPIVRHHLLYNEQSKEYLLDFVLGDFEFEKSNEVMIEWNAYRYIPYTDTKGNKGVKLFGYSLRAYGSEECQQFMANLPNKRKECVDALAEMTIPK